MYGAGSPGYFTLFRNFHSCHLFEHLKNKKKKSLEWERKKIYGNYSVLGWKGAFVRNIKTELNNGLERRHAECLASFKNLPSLC